jgi:hypothetical protein
LKHEVRKLKVQQQQDQQDLNELQDEPPPPLEVKNKPEEDANEMKRIATVLILFQLIGCTKQPIIIKQPGKIIEETTTEPVNRISFWESLSKTQIIVGVSILGLAIALVTIIYCCDICKTKEQKIKKPVLNEILDSILKTRLYIIETLEYKGVQEVVESNELRNMLDTINAQSDESVVEKWIVLYNDQIESFQKLFTVEKVTEGNREDKIVAANTLLQALILKPFFEYKQYLLKTGGNETITFE